ncbi:hypothetical protein IOD13_06895 [Brevibacterium casei]|nr:hypothetical protein [Brevibacterium casei]
MTWHYETTIAEVVHRLRDDTGESVWGSREPRVRCRSRRDARHGVGAPADGETEVLLVDPLPGGFVLDAVRAVHGLTEAEIHTLLRGCFAELAAVGDQASRLGLDCFALDAEGRPRLIPGVRHRLETSVRRAIGELVYHAAYGSPWSEALRRSMSPSPSARAGTRSGRRSPRRRSRPAIRRGGRGGGRRRRGICAVGHSSRTGAAAARPGLPRPRSGAGDHRSVAGRSRAGPDLAGRRADRPGPGDVGARPGERSGRLGAGGAPACRGRFTRASIPVEAWGADPQVGSATATSGIHPILVVDQAADERRSGALGHRRVDRRRRPRGSARRLVDSGDTTARTRAGGGGGRLRVRGTVRGTRIPRTRTSSTASATSVPNARGRWAPVTGMPSPHSPSPGRRRPPPTNSSTSPPMRAGRTRSPSRTSPWSSAPTPASGLRRG